MTSSQAIALAVLAAVVVGLIWGRIRHDVVALCGAAVLLITGVVRPVEAQAAFASPAIVALASLFVIAQAMELSGLISLVMRIAERVASRLGEAGVWLVLGLAGVASAFLNNTPIVVLSTPVVAHVAEQVGAAPRRFLIPLSYMTIMGGSCTLIGTSTNLLVADMARAAGQPSFGLFEATPAALSVAAAGVLYLLVASRRLLSDKAPSGIVGEPAAEALNRPLNRPAAIISSIVFISVVVAAAARLAPIAAAAFAGAVAVVLTRSIHIDDAYKGLRPQVLLLIASMVLIGLAVEVTGLARLLTGELLTWLTPFGPLFSLAILSGITLFLTELLSNAAVAVLLTPVAVALAQTLGVDPRPFLVAVMLAASAAFATPFGYQTNVIVFQAGGYSYLDFVRIGLPLNLVTWAVGVAVIPRFFPF